RISGVARILFTSALILAMTAVGVRAGATRPNQVFASKPWYPASAMVGTSGNDPTRLDDVTARARRVPPLICASAEGTEAMNDWICPPMRSVIAWADPLYGMCCSLMPAVDWNSSPVRCATVPFPGDANVTSPGFFFAAVTRSETDLNGEPAGT